MKIVLFPIFSNVIERCTRVPTHISQKEEIAGEWGDKKLDKTWKRLEVDIVIICNSNLNLDRLRIVERNTKVGETIQITIEMKMIKKKGRIEEKWKQESET